MAAPPIAHPAPAAGPQLPDIPAPPTGTRARLCDGLLRETLAQGKRIILYDDVCLVCSWAVNFVVDHDASARQFTFAPLQSELGAHIIARKGIPVMDSVLLIEPAPTNSNGTAVAAPLERAHWYCHSTAILRIVASLQPQLLFGLLWFLLLVPAFVRDTAYKLFASFRFRIFGTVGGKEDDNSCCRPVTRDTRWRFLEYQLRDMTKQAAAEHKEEQAGKAKQPTLDSAAVFAAAAAVSAAAAGSGPSAAEATETQLGGVSVSVPDAIREQTDREMQAEHGHAHERAWATSEEEAETDAVAEAAESTRTEKDVAFEAPEPEAPAAAEPEEEGAKKRKKKKKGAQ